MQVPDTSITSFKFDVSYICSSSNTREIDDWISLICRLKKSEEIRSAFSQLLLTLVRSVTLLKLKQLKMVNISPSNFPSLKVLCLEYVEFDSVRKLNRK